MNDHTLGGWRIIILEDDYYQAQDCRVLLEEAGAQVIAMSGMFPDLPRLLEQGKVDAALIDINLGHGLSFDFARELRSNGIPFLFLTGYHPGMLPADLAGSPHVSKPADRTRIIAALTKLAPR